VKASDCLANAVLLLMVATLLAACSPDRLVRPTPSATIAPTVVTVQTASPERATPPALYLTVMDANAAFTREQFSTALRLYRQAAGDDSLNDPLPSHSVPPGPELRAFARFRIVLTDAVVAQEDDARAVLEQMRQDDSNTAFLRLALVFWDTYGMTADLAVACNQVTRLVQADPQPVLRSLNNWGAGRPELAADDVCKLP
jgi:hypothetical protein